MKGTESFLAEDGQSALSMVEEEIPDAVFLDIWLPDKDGMVVLEEMRKGWPMLPVVMISGHGSIDLAVRATKLGAYDFVENPFLWKRCS